MLKKRQRHLAAFVVLHQFVAACLEVDFVDDHSIRFLHYFLVVAVVFSQADDCEQQRNQFLVLLYHDP